MFRKKLLPALASVGVAALLLSAAPAHAATNSLDSATTDGISSAMHTEAFDYASHTLRAEQAAREGNPAAAAVFSAAAAEDRDVHLANLAEIYGLVGTDAQNLQAAIDGETYEATVMYPEFAATALTEGCGAAYSMFKAVAAEEWMHARKYRAALSAITSGTGSIPRAGSLNWATVTPSTPLCGADSQTQQNLNTAMHGEAMAKQKYSMFAEHARAGGNLCLAQLFEVTGEVEFREHFSNQATMSGLLGDTNVNLERASANETWEATVFYPGLAAQTSDPTVQAAYTQIAADETAQAASFLAAR